MAIEKFVDGYIRYQIRGKISGKPAGLYLFAGPPGTVFCTRKGARRCIQARLPVCATASFRRGD
nr:hypothetical protein [uncultured Acetatifactor sp.]